MGTFGTLFSGGELFGVGAKQAGYRHAWGIESGGAIAAAAEMNGFHVLTADVAAVDYAALSRVSHLHMSPPCVNASQAKTDAGETEGDVALAEACARAIHALRPESVSLENVWGYRTFESFRLVLRALTEGGYAVDFWHLNAANYGVPQTRRRLILLASKHTPPRTPVPTHHDPSGDAPGQMALFERHTLPWVGWYAAIEDLVPTLPESQLAPWQLARLPDVLFESLLAEGTAAGIDNPFSLPRRTVGEPAFTIRATTTVPRAFLVSKHANKWGRGVVFDDTPAYTIVADSRDRAVLVDSKSAMAGQRLTRGASDTPAFTVTASHHMRDAKAWLAQGRTVKMTPRALARFQSVPDDYRLPDANTLAVRIIGNGVPCLLAKAVMLAAKESTSSTTPG